MPTDPDLYRDTILTLTWDYFGFDNNLYKPAGYFDGIYLWNPRTWNTNSDIHFSFQDLIQCGSQYVVYPCFDPTMYKLFIDGNFIIEDEDIDYVLSYFKKEDNKDGDEKHKK